MLEADQLYLCVYLISVLVEIVMILCWYLCSYYYMLCTGAAYVPILMHLCVGGGMLYVSMVTTTFYYNKRNTEALAIMDMCIFNASLFQ